MKVKVLKPFKDKHNGRKYKADEVINVTKKRFAEILETDLLVEEITENTGEENEPTE